MENIQSDDRENEKKKKLRNIITDLLYDYAENSTLHGFRYIVSRGISFVEKFFWFIVVVVSVVLCAYCINNFYLKWKSSPVIVTVNERLTSVTEVPFPAVMICPENKVLQRKYNFTAEVNKFSTTGVNGSDLTKLLHVGHMCGQYFGRGDDKTFITNITHINDITEVAPRQIDIFDEIFWYDMDAIFYEPQLFFSRVYTEHGVCYTSNTLAANEIFENNAIQSQYQYLLSNNSSRGWSVENGYDYSVNSHYPRRGRAFGSRPDLELLLQTNYDDKDDACENFYTGFKIYLHHPGDYPQSTLYHYAALPDQLTTLAISFNEFTSDPALARYSPEIRQCNFPEDRKLRYFKIYTAKNCEAECLSNYTFAHCKCVGYFMPHDNSSELCGVDSQECIQEAKDIMSATEMKKGYRLDQKACRCLPACDSIEYDAEVHKTDYNLEYLRGRCESCRYSRVILYFKKPQFLTIQRRELYGFFDLLANIGGLLGLFLGFSFLSIIEIIYYLTMRLGCTLKRENKQEAAKKTSVSKEQ